MRSGQAPDQPSREAAWAAPGHSRPERPTQIGHDRGGARTPHAIRPPQRNTASPAERARAVRHRKHPARRARAGDHRRSRLERAAEIFGLVDGPAIAGSTDTEGTMMAKYKRKKPQLVADRLHWLAPHVEDFKACLARKGYSAATITELARLLACWAEWVRNAGFDIGTIETGFAASAEIFRGEQDSAGAAGRGRVVHRLSPTERCVGASRAATAPGGNLADPGRLPVLDA